MIRSPVGVTDAGLLSDDGFPASESGTGGPLPRGPDGRAPPEIEFRSFETSTSGLRFLQPHQRLSLLA